MKVRIEIEATAEESQGSALGTLIALASMNGATVDVLATDAPLDALEALVKRLVVQDLERRIKLLTEEIGVGVRVREG